MVIDRLLSTIKPEEPLASGTKRPIIQINVTPINPVKTVIDGKTIKIGPDEA